VPEVIKYDSSLKKEWNLFVGSSRNGTFLFNRDYMDYHSDRFDDYSLVVYEKGKIMAILPGNISGSEFYSHQGLTYGGLVLPVNIGTSRILDIFHYINDFLRIREIKTVNYKPVPYIYHHIPSQEDLYALFRLGATRTGCHISSTIRRGNSPGFTESRLGGIRKSRKMSMTIREEDDFSGFWRVLTENLMQNHQTHPVHKLDEINLLKSRFPSNIRLHTVRLDNEVIAGTVIYCNRNVAHVQYISASETGKKAGALDLLFNDLIYNFYTDFEYFDFGVSTEKMGLQLNEKLVFQKEGFGGRGIVYEIYKYNL